MSCIAYTECPKILNPRYYKIASLYYHFPITFGSLIRVQKDVLIYSIEGFLCMFYHETVSLMCIH